jgi:hypothetical protein
MGVFDGHKQRLFTTYAVRLEFRDKLMGGTPKDPKAIEGWLKKNAGLAGGELRRATVRTLIENGVDLTENPTDDEINAAIAGVASLKQTQGFKTDKEHGLYVEARAVKAMLKESVNVAYAGEKRGPTRKGFRSFFAERVFVNPDRIYVGTRQPSGVELFVGHVTGREGPRSTLTYVEYVERPVLACEVIVFNDEITEDEWPTIWVHAGENGFGALRSQGFGRFEVERWDTVEAPARSGITRIA